MKKRTQYAWLIVAAVLAVASFADEISGTIRFNPTITHTAGANGASDLSETISDVWRWAGSSSSVGTNGTATDLTALYAGVSNNMPGKATNTVDLSGAINDSFGNPLNMTRVKLLVFVPTNAANQAATFTIRPAAAAGFTNWCNGADGVTIPCGGFLGLANPGTNYWPVTGGACDSLEIVNNATNAGGYKLIIAGE